MEERSHYDLLQPATKGCKKDNRQTLVRGVEEQDERKQEKQQLQQGKFWLGIRENKLL